MRARSLFRRWVALGLGLALVAAACGGDDSDTADEGDSGDAATGATASASDCPGEPLKFGVVVNLTGQVGAFPDVEASGNAAVQAINAECQLGQPVELIVCDEEGDPNQSQACGREMVSEEVIAVVGAVSGFGDQYMPVIEAAGIPSFGNVATSQAENTSALSFPSVSSPVILLGHATAAASAGASKVSIVHVDIPSVTFIADLVKGQVASLGLELGESVAVPVGATDLAPYVAQALSDGADGVIVVLGEGYDQFMRALDQQGADLDDVAVVLGSGVVTGDFLDEVGDLADGLYVVGAGWPVSDDSNEGIAQYQDELEAVGADVSPTDFGLNTWSMMHAVADLLEDSPTMDTGTLVAALESAGEISRPERAAIDLSQPAFPDDPVLSAFRVFGRDVNIARVADGQLESVVDGFVDVSETAQLSD
jgi:ABC-type branched-subunit amino acid transport system substrate-binding protein